MARVVSNFARKSVRETRRRKRREEVSEEVSRERRTVPTAVDLVGREVLLRRVVDAVLGLDEPYRSTVLLRFYEDLSIAEMAEWAGVPESTVRTRLQRALDRLRERLSRPMGSGTGTETADSERDGSGLMWLSTLLTGWTVAPRRTRGQAFAVGESKTGSGWTWIPRGPVGWIAATSGIIIVGALLWRVPFLPASSSTVGKASPVHRAKRRTLSDTRQEKLFPLFGLESEENGGDGSGPGETKPGSGFGEASTKPGSVLIRVSWSDGNPASGVRARLVPADRIEGKYRVAGQKLNLVADREGRIRVPSVPVGQVVLVVDRIREKRRVTVEPGKTTEFALRLPVGRQLEGKVLDPEGKPVPGAELLLLTRHRYSDAGVVVGRSDSSGGFSVRDISRRSFLGARLDGRSPSPLVSVGGSGGGDSVVLEVGPEGSDGRVKGMVVDGRGRPISGARIIIEDPTANRRIAVAGAGGAQLLNAPYWTRSDGNGRFDVRGLSLENDVLFAIAPGFAPALIPFEPEPGFPVELQVALRDGVKVEGRVVAEDGLPVVGASVKIRDEGSISHRRFVEMETDQHGRYEILGVTPGTLLLDVTGPRGQGSASWRIDVEEGEVVEWNPKLEANLRVLGTIESDRGVPLVGYVVTVWSPDRALDDHVRELFEGGYFHGVKERRVRDFQRVVGETDENGRFVLSCRFRQMAWLSVLAPGGKGFPCLRGLPVVPGGPELALSIPTENLASSMIRGRLPVPSNGEFTWRGIAATRVEFPEDRLRRKVGADGTFRLGLLPAGRYALTSERLRRGRPETIVLGEVHLEPGETENLDFRHLDRQTGAMRVRTRGWEESGLFPILAVRDQSGTLCLDGTFRDGIASIDGLIAGEYRVTIEGTAQVPCAAESVSVSVEAGQTEDVALTLNPGIRCRVELLEREPTTVRPQRVRVLHDDDRPVVTLESGVRMDMLYRGFYLNPGSYRLVLLLENGIEVEERITVPESEQTQVFQVQLP